MNVPLSSQHTNKTGDSIEDYMHKNRFRFEYAEFEDAFRAYLNAIKHFNYWHVRVRLVVSFHEYSSGLWIEVKWGGDKFKLLAAEDFILQEHNCEN